MTAHRHIHLPTHAQPPPSHTHRKLMVEKDKKSGGCPFREESNVLDMRDAVLAKVRRSHAHALAHAHAHVLAVMIMCRGERNRGFGALELECTGVH